MKLIFLDIDGVLNSAAWFKRRKGMELDKDNFHFDPKAVKELNRITDETGAKIVLSSTWRKHRSIEDLKQLFENVGRFEPRII